MGIRHSSTGITSPNNPQKQVSRNKYLEDHVIDPGTVVDADVAADAAIAMGKLAAADATGDLHGWMAAADKVKLDALGHPSRQTVVYTTASLDPDASEVGTVAMAKGYRLIHMAVTRLCRVRLYVTTAQRDADLARSVTVDPADDAGCILDYVTTLGHTDVDLSPVVDGFCGSANVPLSVVNLGTEGTVGVTFTWVLTEV